MRATQNTHLVPAAQASAVFVIPTRPGELEERMRGVLRKKHYSLRTEETYVGWYRDFVRWHKPLKPWEMDTGHLSAYLTHLAQNRGVAATTQNQALNALVFLYKRVPLHQNRHLTL